MAIRSDTILATNNTPPSVAPIDTDIVPGETNENSVSPSEATKSTLLSGVTGGTAWFCFFFRQNGFLAPGTGNPQI